MAWPHPVLLAQPLSPSGPILDNANFLILLRMVEFASNLMIVGSNLILKQLLCLTWVVELNKEDAKLGLST